MCLPIGSAVNRLSDFLKAQSRYSLLEKHDKPIIARIHHGLKLDALHLNQNLGHPILKEPAKFHVYRLPTNLAAGYPIRL